MQLLADTQEKTLSFNIISKKNKTIGVSMETKIQ